MVRKGMMLATVLLCAWTAPGWAVSWKSAAAWCASDSSASAGDVLADEIAHAEAKTRYCDACQSAKDQYDAVLACYAPASLPKATAEREAITAAGRAEVNRFMTAIAAPCCKTAR